MTGETYLNGRPAADWELPVIDRARECERARDLALLAGVLTGEPARVVPQGLDLPAIGAEIRRRRTDSISLPVLS